MTEPPVDPTVELARDAMPARTAGRSQQWRWAILSRVDRKGQVPRAAIIAAAGVAAIAVAGWRFLGAPSIADEAGHARPAPVTPPASSRPAPRVRQLADGSRIVLDGPDAVLHDRVETAEEVRFELESGTAHFEVAPQRSRTFQVQAGPIVVKVIGTRFEVQRLGPVSRVSVAEGHVLVTWAGGSRDLRAGDEGTFPADSAQPAAAPAAKTTTTRPASTEAGPAALFERADRARREGKPELAVGPLRTIVERHPEDPHAAMAAFTLGRLSLDSLNQPRQSAAWFEKARALATGRPLAEDALAREVEAWRAAGDSVLARRRAELYRQTYPQGSRLKNVLRLGGLDPAP
jgi:transmembrane sensor